MKQKEKNIRTCCWLLLSSRSDHFHTQSSYMGGRKKASVMKSGEFSDILQKYIDGLCTNEECAITGKWCDYITLPANWFFVSTGIVLTGMFSFAVVPTEAHGVLFCFQPCKQIKYLHKNLTHQP